MYITLILFGGAVLISIVILSPILGLGKPIAETLYFSGKLTFFGYSFPETISNKRLKRPPKPSKQQTCEDKLYRIMVTRLGHLTKLRFWKLLWHRWICRGCNWEERDLDNDKHSKCDCVLAVVWVPVCFCLVILHALPISSVWANYIGKQIKVVKSPGENTKRIKCFCLLLTTPFCIFVFCLMIWNFLVIFGQFIVFVFIDVLRNASTTLPIIVLVLGIFMYVHKACQEFEDGYRELKSLIFPLCQNIAEQSKDANVVVEVNGRDQPLFLKTEDGETSIPTKVFYDICDEYRPYAKQVQVTCFRLFLSIFLIVGIFLLILKFNIFDEFSEVGETMLTVATVTLPSLLGLMKSAPHKGLSLRRRESLLRVGIRKMTSTRKLNEDKATQYEQI